MFVFPYSVFRLTPCTCCTAPVYAGALNALIVYQDWKSAEELDPSLGHIRSLRGPSEIGMKFPPFRVVYKKEVSMACEDGDAKVKGKLPGVGSADRRESCWLTRKECPLSLSMALANPAPFLLYLLTFYFLILHMCVFCPWNPSSWITSCLGF